MSESKAIDVAGWGWPLSAKKAHYFDHDWISLCGLWMYAGPREADSGSASTDDCVACRRKLEKMSPQPTEPELGR